MGMREYPDATYKVDKSIIKEIHGYLDFTNKLDELNMDLGHYAHYAQYGDADYLREAIEDGMSSDQEVAAEHDEFYKDSFIDSAIEDLDKLFSTLQKNFKKTHKGFGIDLRWINSDCAGDVRESFFELTGYVKPKANKLASWVGWSEWA